ncbi:MAG: 50S ribosomal protein L25 [Candidatus Saccharimonadales bacterium]
MSEDAITLHVQAREVTGKAVKHLRREGHVPAVIHDHGKDSINVQGTYLDMFKTFQKAGKHHPIELTAGDRKFVVLIKSAMFEPRKNQLTHLVFNAVNKNQKVEAEVPVRAHYDEGNDVSPAERNSLIVLTQLETVEVRAVPSKIPDFLEYDAEKLVAVGDHVTVADVKIPEGVELITELEHSIASVFEPSALAAANDAAGGDAEPEDAAGIDSESGDAADDVPSQDAENRPGGKEQKEDHEQGTNPDKQ